MKTNSINNFEEALTALSVTKNTLTSLEQKMLDEQGFLVLPNIIDKTWLWQLRVAFERLSQNPNTETETRTETGTRHVSNLVEAGAIFERLFSHPKLLAATHYILKRDFKLSSLHGRDPLPSFGQQGLHTDWLPRLAGTPFQVVTSIWLLDDFTTQSGPTRLVPSTHLLTTRPTKAQSDPNNHHPQEILVEAAAGAVLIFNGHLWHSGTRNQSQPHRRAVICGFTANEYALYSNPVPSDFETLTPAVGYLISPKNK